MLYRLAPEFVSENGLTKVPAEDEYVYTTTSPLAAPLNEPAPAVPQRDGSMLAICQVGNDPASTSEIEPACGTTNRQDAWNTASAANPRATGGELPAGTQEVAWYFPFLVEAIDPAQEARLDGLDHAITSGSYLSESAGPVSYSAAKPDAQTRKIGGCAWAFDAQALPGTRCQWTSVPVLAADASPMQEALQVTEYRMPQSAAAMVGKGATADTLATALPGTAPAGRTGSLTVTAQQVFSQLLGQLAGKSPASSIVIANATGANDFETLMTASPVGYTSRDGVQAPQVVPPGQVVSDSEFLSPYSTVPLQDVFPDLTDTAVRGLVEHDRPSQPDVPNPPSNINGWLNAPQLNLVGTFNPSQVSDGSSALSAVPMQTYFPDTATAADAASARALGGEPLQPNGNIGRAAVGLSQPAHHHLLAARAGERQQLRVRQSRPRSRHRRADQRDPGQAHRAVGPGRGVASPAAARRPGDLPADRPASRHHRGIVPARGDRQRPGREIRPPAAAAG